MGISAARVHGALPRALNVAVVAVERHRNTLQLTDRKAAVLFVRRAVARLDVQRHQTELGQGWVTTVEQTLLDLIARPELGDVQTLREKPWRP
ncbi:type IV toxin-antitoxin system AbiEi family antitoxin [Fodinicola feengrottensis]|uniref:type IV toxin-antitoxin system AbiEi family antitoxin n=1 Tax=Fodinicola feengrottensis TaxID=435914 RepID=UPI0036F3F909